MTDKNARSVYKVLMNDAGHYTIVPEKHAISAEFRETGKIGTIEECVIYICHRVKIGNGQLNVVAEQAVITGFVPLTPVQHKFFNQHPPAPHHWNIACMFELNSSITPAILERSIYYVLKHHDALRLRFRQNNATWQQTIVDMSEALPFSQIDLSHLPDTEKISTLETLAAEQQTSLNLSEGPLIRFVLFNLSQKSAYLLIIINHLVCDGYSLNIVLDDLTTACQHMISGKTVQLPLKTTSFKYWTERQVEYAQSEAGRQELDYWLKNLQMPHGRLPVDKVGGILTESTACDVTMALSEEESRILLGDVLLSNQVTITDVLMTALGLAFTRWAGMNSWIIELVSHGRMTIFDDIDLSRTVGWLVTHTPILIHLEPAYDVKTNLQNIKEHIRCIPNYGFGYEVLRYLAEDTGVKNKLANLPHSDVIFNFYGRDGSTSANTSMSPIQANLGPSGVHKNVPRFLLIFNGMIIKDQLYLRLNYSETVYYRSTIENLAQHIMNAISELIVTQNREASRRSWE